MTWASGVLGSTQAEYLYLFGGRTNISSLGDRVLAVAVDSVDLSDDHPKAMKFLPLCERRDRSAVDLVHEVVRHVHQSPVGTVLSVGRRPQCGSAGVHTSIFCLIYSGTGTGTVRVLP